MFSAFRKKNLDRGWRYLTIARRADGGITVSPGGGFGGSFRLTEDEIEPYLAWDARRRTREMRISWLFVIVVVPMFLLLMYGRPEYSEFALIGIVFLLFINKKWAVRSFGARFPNSPPARDGDKWRRLSNSMMVSMPRWFCILGTIFFWWMAWGWVGRSYAEGSMALTSGYSALGIFRHAVHGGMILTLTAVCSFLTFEHFRFRRRHGRAPSKDDIAPPY